MDFAELGLRNYYEIQGLAFVAVVADQIRRRVWDRVASLKKGYSLPKYLLKMRESRCTETPARGRRRT